MKKAYINPDMKIVNVALSQMIAVSTEMYGKDAQGEAMSRRGGNLWDDDDDEDLE